MTLITIRETAQSDGGWQVAVSFDHSPAYMVTVSNPFSEEEERRLEWYFERWLRFPFVSQVKAGQAAVSVVAYGERLFEQLFKADAELYADYREVVRGGLAGLEVEVSGSAAFHGLHWEALKDPKLARPFAVEVPMVRKGERLATGRAKVRASSTLNILLVTARPYGRRDVSYRTISRPLVTALHTAKVRTRIDMVRPGTYSALVNHLESSRDAHGDGYYHVIHFDMHGAELPHDEYQKGVASSRYLFAAPYGRPEVKKYDGQQAFLFFDGGQRGQADPVTAEALANLLKSHQIPIAILNACQSAKQVTDRQQEVACETSLGSRLMEAGVQVVLAMGYSVTVSAAKLLMTSLYEHLLAGQPLATAIRRARLELYNRKQRQAYHDQMIELEDWLLPVVYQNRAVRLPVSDFGSVEEELAYYQQQQARYRARQPSYGFVGRDIDILEIEKRLASEHNLLLVRGMGGAGKTTLLQHLAQWWQTTHLVEQVFYYGYDEKAYTRQQLLTDMAQKLWGNAEYYRAVQPFPLDIQQSKVESRLRAERHLLILDNCESITGNALAIKNTLDSQQQAALKGFLAALAGGKTLVLLGSRSSESWLMEDDAKRATPLREEHIYELPGLDPEAASQLAEGILLRHNVSHYHTDEDFRRLLKLLDGYPLALEVVLANLARQTPSEVLTALQAGDIKLDSDDKTDKTKSILRCIEYSHSNLSPDAQALLACLAPFTGVFNTEPLNNYTKHLKQQPILAHLPFDLWPTVLQEAVNWGLLSPDPDIPAILRLHPILPYFLRSHLNDTARKPMYDAIQTAFRQHYHGVGLTLHKMLKSKEAQQKQLGLLLTKWEYENLTTALNHALAAQVSTITLWYPLSLYLDSTQEQQRGLALGETVLAQLESYPPDKLTGQLGAEFEAVIDNIANRQLWLKKYAAAQTSYQKELDILFKNKSYSAAQVRERSASIYHQLGRVAEEQRQWQEAEHYYLKALQIYIDFNDRYEQADTYHQLGIVGQEQGQWQEAEQYYLKALQIKIDFNDRYSQGLTYHQLGWLAQEQHQWQEAEQYYLKALQIKIDFNDRHSQASTYHNLGVVAQAQRQWQEAEQYYLKALQIKIDFNDRYRQASTYHQLGSVAQAQRQWQEAEQYYLKALQIKIDFNARYEQAKTYHHLGMVAQEQRQWQEAEHYYLKALQIKIDFNDRYAQASTYHQLGSVAQEQRQWQEAEQYYLKALQINIDFNDRYEQALTYGQLGLLAAEQKQWEEAR